MDLSDIRSAYESASSKASEVARQLAFAGIAIVWLFSGASVPTEANLQIEGALLLAGFLLVLCLAFDFLHAVYRTAAWGIYGAYLERHGRHEDVDAPAWINHPSIGFFCAKLACVGVAYAVLAVYLGARLA